MRAKIMLEGKHKSTYAGQKTGFILARDNSSIEKLVSEGGRIRVAEGVKKRSVGQKSHFEICTLSRS